jgi:transposase
MFPLEESTIKELRRLQRSSKDRRVYIKATVILMLHKQFSAQDIADSLGIDDETVHRYRRAFQALGLQSYLDAGFVPYTGKLSDEQEAQLCAEVRANLYLDSREVVAYIEHTFGIRYSRSAVTKLLKRLGFVYKKTKAVPAFADRKAQEQFVATLETLLERAEDQVVYFNDGVHPLHNTRPDYGWIFHGETFDMPTNPGRNRVNLTGALNAHDVTDIEVLEADRINAQATMALWETLLLKHPDKTIYNICDNAKYYHARVLKDWLAQNPRCKVLYLPPYAPNLNLIEHLWKYLRKEVISHYFYETFDEFRRAILGFFRNIKEHKQALESLLTLKFRIIGI